MKHPIKPPSQDSPDQKTRLRKEYGDNLGENGLSNAQQEELLLALWNIMSAFVDLGLPLHARQKCRQNSRISCDDVLEYLHFKATAPETVASPEPTNKQEHS